jgi:glycosyltransferase involved in cell wall biosynthesis
MGVAERLITVVPNGVDSRKFRPMAKAEARSALGVPTDAKVILSVGHLTANKGVLFLIRALKKLLDAEPARNMLLLIAGGGEYRRELEREVAALELGEQVRFLGPVAHDRLYVCYSAADVSCLLSEMEGWPNVILESIACGTPVVATAVGGVPEIIRSDEVGLLTAREDASVADAIRQAINRPWSAARLIDYAKQHDWSEAAMVLRNLFRAAIDYQGAAAGRTAPISETSRNTGSRDR